MIDKKNEPLDTIHIDHLGPLVTTTRQNKHLFAVVDAFTKYTWGFPVRSTTTKSVITCLKRLFDTYGVPRRIICDRGPAFTSLLFRAFCAELGIRLNLISVRVPRANGQVERCLSTILERLIAIIPDETSWDKYISQVLTSVNNTVNSTTRYTPHELFHGYQLRTQNETYLVHEIENNENNNETHNEHIQRIRTEAERNIQAHNAKIEEQTKNKKKPRQFSLNDIVYLPNVEPASGSSRKLKPRWKGPYRITACLQNDRYRIQEFDDRHRKYNGVYSSENLKKYCIYFEPEDELSSDEN
jgi:hypothetical protein